jgi:hypothetical protein
MPHAPWDGAWPLSHMGHIYIISKYQYGGNSQKEESGSIAKEHRDLQLYLPPQRV